MVYNACTRGFARKSVDRWGNVKEPSRAIEPRAVADAIRHRGPPGHRPQPTGRGRRQHGQPGGPRWSPCNRPGAGPPPTCQPTTDARPAPGRGRSPPCGTKTRGPSPPTDSPRFPTGALAGRTAPRPFVPFRRHRPAVRGPNRNAVREKRPRLRQFPRPDPEHIPRFQAVRHSSSRRRSVASRRSAASARVSTRSRVSSAGGFP